MTSSSNFLLLSGEEIHQLFKGQEQAILDAVRSAYITHREGSSCLPHSSFVKFPGKERERIIALPAYLGGPFEVAGLKWIASFPENLQRGMERASAQLTLNDTETGYPLAFMESSIISAKRTAASAALAAHHLKGDAAVSSVGLLGAGLINFETLRFLFAARPGIKQVRLFDLSEERAMQFLEIGRKLAPECSFVIANSMADAFAGCDVIALATTAVKPHISDLSMLDRDSIVLHTSLRDLETSIVLEADNMIDDYEHALRAQTSLHLAEQQVGHRDFVRCEIADIFTGKQPTHTGTSKLRIFSPFGLGVLDLALGKLAYDLARSQGRGTVVDDFLPRPWFEREA